MVGPTLIKILNDYPDDVKIAYMMHPLPMHSNAAIAAEAAMAAHAQGKFKPMHEKLEENSRQLSRDKILEIAKGLGLNMDQFTKDLDSNAHKAEIDRMTKAAMEIGATGTPANFINGRYLSGAAPYDTFKKLIDEELIKAGGKPPQAPAAGSAPAAPAGASPAGAPTVPPTAPTAPGQAPAPAKDAPK